MINVSLLGAESDAKTSLKIFGKKSGNTSILIIYRDNSIQNYHVYVNQNLGFVQKMINMIEPDLSLSKVGNGSTVISGEFDDPHEKTRIYDLLESAGIDMSTLMDLTRTKKVNKMVRTKLYLVEVNNQKAKELGGVTGLGFFDKYTKVFVNPEATASATFSGFLLDHTGSFVSQTGHSVVSTLNFLEEEGIAKILDDTVLITTEDKNASFHVGGEVYIPIGLTQNVGTGPTIQLEEKEYGLRLTLRSNFMEKKGFMHVDVEIKESEFDTNHEHDVQLGEFTVVPSFTSKNIHTDIVAQSGQVIALGGRLHSEEVEREEKIPLLGDIPLIGGLFRSTVTAFKENDLLFFLVPEIVDANEDIDDTHFYRDFKNSGLQMHEDILDMNVSRLEPIVLVEEKKVKVAETKIEAKVEKTIESVEEPFTESKQEPVFDSKTQSQAIAKDETQITTEKETMDKKEVSVTEDVVIEIVDSKSEAPETKAQAILEESSLERQKVDQEENVVSPDIALAEIVKKEDKEDIKIVGTKISDISKDNTNEKYRVSTAKIFLRTNPIDGKRITVWKEGHEFTIEDEKNINGSPWFKVKEDCFDSCDILQESLWIAKKYTEKI